ncbi:unnamed protein product [Linum tenue]|uniref:Uncharacterized protein n=1 Tax=Linum tenue TaxID=586396 RepID=A0AAV0GU54_9ROSI|nr:unnamed protein product [Linum tenue]
MIQREEDDHGESSPISVSRLSIEDGSSNHNIEGEGSGDDTARLMKEKDQMSVQRRLERFFRERKRLLFVGPQQFNG